ncbi:MAG: hypothetical protein R3C99_17195 [Pirellulaceae bacterium]
MDNCRILDNGTVNEDGVRSGVGMCTSYHVGHQVRGESGWDWVGQRHSRLDHEYTDEGNGTYGLCIGWGRDENIRLVNSPIRGHRSAGLYVSNCEFDFTPQTMGSKWQLFENGSHIYASWGTYLFENQRLRRSQSRHGNMGIGCYGSQLLVYRERKRFLRSLQLLDRDRELPL